MVAAVVTIICIAMIVIGGMTLSQGILTSADAAAIDVSMLSVIESEMTRTDLDILRATPMAWADYLRVTVKNSGQTKLANFDKWDTIVNYTDGGSQLNNAWLPYTAALPGDNQWQMARIGLNGPVDFYEPGILNPSEEMVALIHLNPLMGNATSGDISMSTPNGVYTSMLFTKPGTAYFTAQSENITLANTKYYELVEAAPADGAAITCRADFNNDESGRKLLYHNNRPVKLVYPLIGITQIPAKQWTVYYRVYLGGEGAFPRTNDDVHFNINILVRAAGGSVRTIINDTGVADAVVQNGEQGYWLTVSGTYNFPVYNVVNQNDYLEIDFYGKTDSGPNGGPGYMLLSIDNGSLGISDQTRMVAG